MGLRLEIKAGKDDLFTLNQALSKLRDLLGDGEMTLDLTVEARTAGQRPLDRVSARNVAIEPFEERPGVEVRPEWLQ